MWHVSSRSGVATLRTAIQLLLTYLLTYLLQNVLIISLRRQPSDAGLFIFVLFLYFCRIIIFVRLLLVAE